MSPANYEAIMNQYTNKLYRGCNVRPTVIVSLLHSLTYVSGDKGKTFSRDKVRPTVKESYCLTRLSSK